MTKWDKVWEDYPRKTFIDYAEKADEPLFSFGKALVSIFDKIKTEGDKLQEENKQLQDRNYWLEMCKCLDVTETVEKLEAIREIVASYNPELTTRTYKKSLYLTLLEVLGNE